MLSRCLVVTKFWSKLCLFAATNNFCRPKWRCAYILAPLELFVTTLFMLRPINYRIIISKAYGCYLNGLLCQFPEDVVNKEAAHMSISYTKSIVRRRYAITEQTTHYSG